MKQLTIGVLVLTLLAQNTALAAPAYIYDSAGNKILATAGALNTNATISLPSSNNTGGPVPAQATYIGANKAGLLTGLLIGQQTMANSLACTLPSDQSAIPVTDNGGSLTVDGTIAATQSGTWTQDLTQVGGSAITLGQKTAANSIPVVLPSDVAGMSVTQSGSWSNSITEGGNTAIVTAAGALKVDGSAVTQPVSGSGNFTVVQPTGTNLHVAVDSMPVVSSTVSGTVTANQGTPNTIANRWPILVTDGTNSAEVTASSALKVDGSAVTQPISAASLPLPAGAATAAKQPSLGTAGSAAIDVISVQGITNMTPLKVDGSANTQPVSGTVTANQGGSWNVNQAGTWVVQPGNTANTTPWLTKLSDGTNAVGVKAASIAATATDPSLVVAMSPNSNTVKVSDGTNTAAVKAASTPAAASDPALVVAISPNSSITTSVSTPTLVTTAGGTLNPYYNNYASTSFNTTYTTLVAAATTTSAVNYVDIFDSSGQIMVLAYGNPGAETIVAYIQPGGASVNVAIPSGARIAYKALSGTVSSGQLVINFRK